MIRIERTVDKTDLTEILALIKTNFKLYEIVSDNDFIYYTENYHKLYPGEDHFVYKIQVDNKLAGMFSGMILKEFVVIIYLIIEKDYRKMSRAIGSDIMNTLLSFNKPLVIEAETDLLCRLYRKWGFMRFKELYKYFTISIDPINGEATILSHNSNLMYYSDRSLEFEYTRNIIYDKCYLRWNSNLGEKYLDRYKEVLYKEGYKKL